MTNDDKPSLSRPNSPGRLAVRNVDALVFAAEMYGLQLDQLASLTGDERSARAAAARWRQLGYTSSDRLSPGAHWVWVTRAGLDACGLDYAFIDAGDGPAVFIILFAGAIVVGSALVVEVKYQPPFWVHAALWLPLILATTLLPLRSMKSLLIALQFHHKAAPGRLIDRGPQ